MAKKLEFEDSDGVVQRKIDIDDTSKEITVYAGDETKIMSIEKHASRHISGGDDPISGLTYSQLAENTIIIRATLTNLPEQTGLAADSTGVKAKSAKALFWGRHVKKLRLLSEVTSIPSDATVRIGVYNVTAGDYVFYRDYEGATGKNIDEYTDTMPSDDNELEIRVEITAASGTSGATFDIGSCVLQVEYGIS